ncbi:2-C-methyl-D-erythritol 4-phosphate cytidylyltransferase [Arachidicoccus ginsenosidimutans]|uniref:2-C-methyl-D-erythritol 4-phosphate cytidylyltransferase n=1 Tax=Arachidicoccus sp. BS20 TaxID=1850526 RepID=UPI0007F0B457|nr:2-C-methyl-D-erythritol 4-phosphate cytidylyltransferase [Arachidicoccus sp. BS20]ANI89517.1 2-C-methyl-D-erythritol 4-phosphate cytidylyltransferase [Arachidicoccus sp. BS20]
MKKFAVIVAGGSGTRMESTIPKQFLLLQNKPILWHSINAFANAFDDVEFIIVLPENFLEEGKKIAKEFSSTHKLNFVAGGETRFHSTQNGLKLINKESIIFVHDAVRCLVTKTLIQNCYTQAIAKGSAVPAIAATDTIRLIDDNDRNILLDRNKIRIIQTPQTFQSNILLPAFQQNYKDSFTDEASVVEAFGKEIFLIDGESENIKITRPVDLVVAESILGKRYSNY